MSADDDNLPKVMDRSDPRLKLPLCGGLAALALTAGNWLQLGAVAAAVLLLAVGSRHGLRPLLSALWSLRWLLLFGLLLHLLLDPGRTLWGIAWLSRDGLLRGLLVTAQLAAATLAAALLAQTTPAALLARAGGWLLAPLRLLGCPVKRWQEQAAVVLFCLPLVQAELQPAQSHPQRGISSPQDFLPVFDRLVGEGERIAQRLAGGDEFFSVSGAWPPFGTLNFFPAAVGFVTLGLFLVSA